MIVPYVDYLPLFTANIITHYSFRPDRIEFVGNMPDQTLENRFDYKAFTCFEKFQPQKWFIMHASDHYLNHDDLREMIEILDKREKAFCIGMHPMKGLHHALIGDTPTYMARIVIWKAPIFAKFLEAGKNRAMKTHNALYDVTNHVASAAHDAGYEAIQATKARMFKVDLK
jgi:hypothetical protein